MGSLAVFSGEVFGNLIGFGFGVFSAQKYE